MASDEEWKQSVETRLVTLVAAQKTADDDIDEMAADVADLDELLRGDRKDRTSGVVGQLNAIEAKVNSILAILHPDATGHGGLINEHREVVSVVKNRERRSEDRWKYWTAVTLALIGQAALLVQGWPRLAEWYENRKKAQIEATKKAEQRKRSKRARARQVRIPSPQAEEPDDGTAGQTVPNVPKADAVN